jgi:hypothetical protein
VVHYEWNKLKADANRRKHGVDFADAVGVLEDPLALTVADDGPGEERWVTLGLDATGRLLVVIYTWRGPDRIRIISARAATRCEREQYEETP